MGHIKQGRYTIKLHLTTVVRPMKTSGVDLTQEERRSNGVVLGMSVDVGNGLDVRKRKG